MYPDEPDPAERAYPVDRHTLRGILLSGLDGALHLGKTFQRYEIGSDGRPTAYFADGTSVTGDVLIGADGINSRLRAQLLPAATRATPARSASDSGCRWTRTPAPGYPNGSPTA